MHPVELFELKDHFIVARLDVGSNIGGHVRKQYQGGIVPTFIVFDRSGTEVWRKSGSVPLLKTILALGL